MTVASMQLAGREAESVRVSARQIEALRSRTTGPLLREHDAGWDDAVRIWNGMAARKPALVLQPRSSSDVATAVHFAREHGVLLGVKGGGHNIAGTAIAEHGLTLDMSRMRGVDVDPAGRTARVAAGCLLGDVDRATQEHGLATVLGFVSKVGVAGLTLGGGLGYLTRRFGWTVDNLLEVEIVTADGSIEVASADQHPDLYWAVRGAGANFGVVTRFTFRLHEVGPMVHGGLIAWPFDRAEEVLTAYRELTAEAPRELAAWLVMLRAPAAPFVPAEWHGRRVCAMAICYSGDLAHTARVLAPLRALPAPIFDLLQELPYAAVQSYLDDTEPDGLHYYWKTEFLEDLSDDVLSIAQRLFADCPIPEAQIGFLHLGGELNERDWSDGAVGNRDVRFAVGVNGVWDPANPAGPTFPRWVRDAWMQLRPYSTGGNYINFQTADEDAARIRGTYGRNFDRLVDLKRRYDPGNLFRANRNIAV